MRVEAPVPEDLAAKLGVETAQIRGILQGNDIVHLEGVANPLEEISWRLRYLQSRGMFYANRHAKRKVTWGELTAAQAQIALIHGLIYKKAGTQSRWISLEGEGPPSALPRRSEHHFTQIFNSTDGRNLQRIDLAMLAHSYQIPIAVMETPKRSIFEAQVDKISLGFNPFLTENALLDALVREDIELIIAPVSEILARCKRRDEPQRGFVTEHVVPEASTINVDEPFAALLELPDIETPLTYALLIGVDPTGILRLLSTKKLMGCDLSHTGAIVIPRADQLVQQSSPLRIDEVGDFGAYLLVSENSLDHFPAYVETNGRTAAFRAERSVLCDQDFEWLRKRFLTSEPGELRCFFRGIRVR